MLGSRRAPTATASLPNPTLEDLLEDARLRIEVTDAELDEALKRRDAIRAALIAELRGSETYVNGSVAHGDALVPLTGRRRIQA